jgi:LmbE family N-acetylglucosaminyl deacetylase
VGAATLENRNKWMTLDFAPYAIDSLWLDHTPKPRTILIAYPHPDDESFGNGGTIARYVAQGVAVHYACATRGECGTVDPQWMVGYTDIAALRTAEQTCAAHALGLAAVHFLGYRDSGMQNTADNENPAAFVQAPLERVAGQLVALIRALRPQVVLTFNPYGGYGHPDHIHIHYATHAAFAAAGDPARYPEQIAADLAPWQPSKLYYPTFGTRFIKIAVGVLRLFGRDPRRFGRNSDVDAIRVIEETTPITTTIDCREWLEPNVRARMCHRSQASGPPLNRLPRALTRRLLGAEHFTRAIPAWAETGEIERDLFEGIAIGNTA